MIGVFLSMFIPNIFNKEFSPYIEAIFLTFLLIVQIMKDIIYEVIHNIFEKEIYIDINIICFELSIAFGTFSTLYSFIYKQKPNIVSYPLATIIYVVILLILGILIVNRIQ